MSKRDLEASSPAPTPIVHTRWFTLRPLVRGDASALFATLSDEAQCRFLSRGAFADEHELAGWLLDPNWNGRSWVAIDKTAKRVSGRFVVVPTSEVGMSELGCITVREWQGQGVARECVAALVSHLFQAENQRRLIAEIDAENVASIAVVERLGFKREAWLREHETTHKGLCDMLVYGLLRHEWRAQERAA
jgi:RimJ/RimL family protein N-acetyltransferase